MSPRTIHARPATIPPGRCGGMLLLAVLTLTGCAGWKPFQSWQKSTKDREKYGPTADARIKELTARSKAAKAQSAERQIEFTQELAAEMLREHDPRVRVRILQTAADYDTGSATAVCKGALQDPADQVRLAACDVWAKRGGEEAVGLLAERFRSDSDHDVRLRALRMLGTLKDKEAIPVLAKALEDSDPAVQYRAVASLKEISGRDLGNDVNVWRAWAADPSTAPEWSVAEGVRQLF